MGRYFYGAIAEYRSDRVGPIGYPRLQRSLVYHQVFRFTSKEERDRWVAGSSRKERRKVWYAKDIPYCLKDMWGNGAPEDTIFIFPEY
jgi:hypothetical protein